MQPHHIAPGHVIYELFRNRSIAYEINIQTFSIICCQLSPPLSPPAICYFGNDLYSCGIRLVRACAHWCNVPGMLSEVILGCSVFVLTPTLVYWQVISLPLFPLPSALTSVFSITQYTFWNATFAVPAGLVSWYLHRALQPIKRLKQDIAQQWAQFTDSINYASKTHLLEFHLLVYCSESSVSFEFQTEWLPLVPKTVVKSSWMIISITATTCQLFSFWSNAIKQNLFTYPFLHPMHWLTHSYTFSDFAILS